MNPKLKDLQKRENKGIDNAIDGTVYSSIDGKQEYHLLKDIPIFFTKQGDNSVKKITLGDYLIKQNEHITKLEENQSKIIKVIKEQNKEIKKLKKVVKKYGLDY